MNFEVKKPLAQQSWANAESTAIEVEFKAGAPAKVVQIELVVSANTNSVTGRISFKTANGGTLVDVSSAAAGAATVFRSYSDGANASDFEAFIMSGTVTATFTPSGDPGTTGVTIDATFWTER